jgi:hypothetical protein
MLVRVLRSTLLVLLSVPTLAAAQTNDECSGATPIKRLPSTRTLAVDFATPGATDPSSSCIGTNANVWYTYTARSDVSLELDANGSSYRAGIAVFTGECGALTEIGCSDRSIDGGPGHLIVPLTKGQTVRIAVTTDGGTADETLTLAARKSIPRYRPVEGLTEILRSSDPSAYGGSQGLFGAVVAQTDKTTAFVQTTDAIVVDVGGALTTVAHGGSPSPVGGNFSVLGAPVVSATDVYFRASVDGGSVAAGIFKWNGTAVTPYLVLGAPGPGSAAITRITGSLAVSPSGVLVFTGRTAGSNLAKILRYDGVDVTVLATVNDAACGETIRSFGSALALDDTGTRAAFFANVRNVGDAVLTADANGISAIACQDAATPLGSTYRGLGNRPAVNALGEVYFTGTLDDAPFKGREVLWVWTSGVTTAVATPTSTLATGETIKRILANQRLATNTAGDVVFYATLQDGGSALVYRPHLAALPSTALHTGDPCPGGTVSGFGDELDLSDAGDLAFDGTCAGRSSAMRKPAAGAATIVASTATATAIGTGFDFGVLAIDSGGTRIATRGFRTTLQSLACAKDGCGPAVGLVDPSTPLANAPGRVAGVLDVRSLVGGDKTLAVIAQTEGGASRQTILRLEKGTLDAVASQDDPLPGGVGTFESFFWENTFLTPTPLTIGVGTGVVAFHTLVANHPTASQGLFAATAKGLSIIALDGDPAPRGDTFEDFSEPSVAGKSIIFAAATESADVCLFATPAAGKAIVAVACPGDRVPGPAGGTIEEFVAPPVGAASDLYVLADVIQDRQRRCLLRYERGKPSVVRCADDVFLGGATFESFNDGSGLGMRMDAKAKTLVVHAFFVDGPDFGSLLALRDDTFDVVVEPGTTPAPSSGGTLSSVVSISPSSSGKTVAFASEIDNGAVVSALLRAQLP